MKTSTVILGLAGAAALVAVMGLALGASSPKSKAPGTPGPLPDAAKISIYPGYRVEGCLAIVLVDTARAAEFVGGKGAKTGLEMALSGSGTWISAATKAAGLPVCPLKNYPPASLAAYYFLVHAYLQGAFGAGRMTKDFADPILAGLRGMLISYGAVPEELREGL